LKGKATRHHKLKYIRVFVGILENNIWYAGWRFSISKELEGFARGNIILLSTEKDYLKSAQFLGRFF